MTAINQTDCAPFSPILTAVTFSLFGFIIGIWADGFEKLQLVPLLIVTPLTFLGGSFYSISMLPPVWRTITLANPIVYLVSGFRWSFYGSSDVSVTIVGCCTDRFTGAFPPALLISRSKREVHSGARGVNMKLHPQDLQNNAHLTLEHYNQRAEEFWAATPIWRLMREFPPCSILCYAVAIGAGDKSSTTSCSHLVRPLQGE